MVIMSKDQPAVPPAPQKPGKGKAETAFKTNTVSLISHCHSELHVLQGFFCIDTPQK